MSAQKKNNGLLSAVRRTAHATQRVAGSVNAAHRAYKGGRPTRAAGTRYTATERAEIARETREARERDASQKRQATEWRKAVIEERAAIRRERLQDEREEKQQKQREQLAEKTRIAAARRELSDLENVLVRSPDSQQVAIVDKLDALRSELNLAPKDYYEMIEREMSKRVRNGGYIDESGTFRPIRGTEGADSYTPTRMGKMKSKTAKVRDAEYRRLIKEKGAKAAKAFLKKTAIKKPAKAKRPNPRPGFTNCDTCDAQKKPTELIKRGHQHICADCDRIIQAVATKRTSKAARVFRNPTLLVTPQIARRLLKTMRNNRALDPARVNKMSGRMKAGTYHDKNGLLFEGETLRDGQHRLNAVIRSGETVTFNVKHANGLETLGRLAMIPGGVLAGMDLHKRLTRTGKGKKAKPQKRASNPSTALPEDKPIKAPANVARILKEFLDKEPSKVAEYLTPPGTPNDASTLGVLLEIHLDDGQVLEFDTNPAMLGATGGEKKRRMHIGLEQRYRMPPGLARGREHDFGAVTAVDYLAYKPHLGYRKEHAFRHEMGERGGRKPHLILIDGLLKFRGGDYKILREGIDN
jgi:hypothetical protein